MTKRVTLGFRSGRGREYLYDDITGSIFPWNDLRETVLQSVLSNTFQENYVALTSHYGENNVQATHRFIKRWRDNFSAFIRTMDRSSCEPGPPTPQLEQYVRNRSFALILILTDNCNLRCQYCILSDKYPLNRGKNARQMDITTARRAVDWYVKLVEPQIARNPQKRFGLSFYGGEPLMNMTVLEDILQYALDNYSGIFQPIMTTNGTLLEPKNVEILAKYEIQLAISIDGPEAEHDRRRRDIHNSGTFGTIIKNLRQIKQDFPDYWASKLTSVSVYDWGTDLELVEKFFAENEDLIPRSVLVNPVNPHNTDWYKQYTESDRHRFKVALERLREKFKRAKIRGDSISHYLNCLIGMSVLLVPLRPRVRDSRPPCIPYSGTCLPGDKVAVHVDGKIDMCERVNGTYPIGHLDQGGINWELVKALIDRYQQHVLLECPQCAATRFCSLCFSHLESKADFVKVPGICVDTVESARRRLADYVSILEENPQADLTFDTDTVHLEERLLFIY